MSWNSLYLPFPLYQDYQPNISPSSSPTSVKIEPDDPDSRFIVELAAFPPTTSSSSRSSPDNNDNFSSPPPTEVPLRATQASKEMRRMMGVFRLNPFSMHNLSRGGDGEDSTDISPTGSATWCGEAGPLEEEPVMFEFQLDISGLDRGEDRPVLRPAEPSSRLPTISAHDESQLRPFSPSFQLHEGDLSEAHHHAWTPPSPRRYDFHHDVDQQQAVSKKDPGNDFRQGQQNDPWEEADYAPQSESDSGTSSSATVSVHTPLNEGSSCSPFDNGPLSHSQDHLGRTTGGTEQSQTSPAVEFPSTPLWDVPEVSDNYQMQEALGPSMNYTHTDISPRGGIVHPNTSHPYMRMTYPSPSYNRGLYAQPSPQFQQAPSQSNFFLPNIPSNHSPSLLHDPRRPSAHDSSPTQEIEPVPQSPSTISPALSPATPNNFQYPSFNQQHGHYQSQNPHHQVAVYNSSNPVTPTSMSLRLPISIARSAMRSAAAYSNAGSPTSCHNQPPLSSSYNMHPTARGYRVSRHPQLEERIGEHETYGSTPHSPVNEEHTEGYVPATAVVTMGMPMHPVLQRSTTYVGVHPIPQLATGGTVVASSPVHGPPNANSRRWSLPEVSVGTPNVPAESFLGHHM